MTHGNTHGPRCIHCHADIYHTAPGGRWVHTHNNEARCARKQPSHATPEIAR